MLQLSGKHSAVRWILILGVMAVLVHCKDSTSTGSEEQATYLADYEKPADLWGFIDKQGRVAIDPVFDAVEPFSEHLAAVNKEGKWGFINLQGKMVILPQYRSAWSFHGNRARVKPFDQPDQYIEPGGKPIPANGWIAADDFCEGLAKVRAGQLFGYIDSSGTMVIPPLYARAWNFTLGTAMVELDNKFGLIDRDGHYILDPRYDKIKRAADPELFICTLEHSSILVSATGEEKLRLENQNILESDGNLAIVKSGDKNWIYHLAHKRLLTNSGYDHIQYLGEHRWAVKNPDGYHLLDAEGVQLTQESCGQINAFHDGLTVYSRDGNWGYMQTDGKELGPPQFGLAWDFREGLARAAFQEGIAFITPQMEIAFYPPPGVMDMRDFSEGLAPVQIQRR